MPVYDIFYYIRGVKAIEASSEEEAEQIFNGLCLDSSYMETLMDGADEIEVSDVVETEE